MDETKLILVVMPDIECISLEVLTPLFQIMIALRTQHRILLALRMTLRTEPPVLNVTGKTIIERFDVATTVTAFEEIMKEVFLSQTNRMQIGFHLYQYIYEEYHGSDLSVTALLKSLKYALLMHFNTHAASALGIIPPDEWILYPEVLDTVRMLPSFRAYMEQVKASDAQEVHLLLTSDTHLSAKLPAMMTKMTAYLERYYAALQVVATIQELSGKSYCWMPHSKLHYLMSQDRLSSHEHIAMLLRLLPTLDQNLYQDAVKDILPQGDLVTETALFLTYEEAYTFTVAL